MHHVVPRLSGTPGAVRTLAPVLGEHNRIVLAEVGIDAVQYEALRAEGVVFEDTAKQKECAK